MAVPVPEHEKPICQNSFPEFLRYVCSSYASSPALSDGKADCTYSELLLRVRRRVAFLHALGLSEGAHIALMSVNSTDAMELLLAIPAAGYVLVMIPPDSTPEKVFELAEFCDAAALFAEEKVLQTVPMLSCIRCPLSSIADSPADFSSVPGSTPAAVFFTSGTTALPKAVVHSHASLLRGAFHSAVDPVQVLHRKTVAMLPLHHIFGTVFGFLGFLYSGSLIYSCKSVADAVLRLQTLRPDKLGLVPGMLEILTGLCRVRGEDALSFLISVGCGGAPLSGSVYEAAVRAGVIVCTGYGLTESAGVSAVNMDLSAKPGSVGKPCDGQSIRIEDGEILLRGENIMLGYYRDEAATAAVLQDGWLRTGDLGYLDEDGYLYLTGRSKNLIILPNGENVSPEALERLFEPFPEVEDCMVSEINVNGRPAIGIEIIPCYERFENCSEAAVRTALMKLLERVNAPLPSYMKISGLKIRTEAFPKNRMLKKQRTNT